MSYRKFYCIIDFAEFGQDYFILIIYEAGKILLNLKLKAEATAEAMKIVMEKLNTDPNAREALQFLLAQNYLEMGKEIGNSGSSKVMFMDPRSMISTIEGVQSVISSPNSVNGSPNHAAKT